MSARFLPHRRRAGSSADDDEVFRPSCADEPQGGRRRLWGCERTDPVGIRSQDAHRRNDAGRAAGTAGRLPVGERRLPASYMPQYRVKRGMRPSPFRMPQGWLGSDRYTVMVGAAPTNRLLPIRQRSHTHERRRPLGAGSRGLRGADRWSAPRHGAAGQVAARGRGADSPRAVRPPGAGEGRVRRARGSACPPRARAGQARGRPCRLARASPPASRPSATRISRSASMRSPRAKRRWSSCRVSSTAAARLPPRAT